MAKDPTHSDVSSASDNTAATANVSDSPTATGPDGLPTGANPSPTSPTTSAHSTTGAAGSTAPGTTAKKSGEKSATPRATTESAPTRPRPASGAGKQPVVQGSLAGGTWIALIAGALLLIVLLVFIMQNQNQVDLVLFAWNFRFPAGIGFLLAAIGGALIMALVGGVRMFQLRRQIIKTTKSLAKTAETAETAADYPTDSAGTGKKSTR